MLNDILKINILNIYKNIGNCNLPFPFLSIVFSCGLRKPAALAISARSQFNQQKGIECFGFRFCGAAGQPSKDSSSCHTHTTKNFRFHHRTNTTALQTYTEKEHCRSMVLSSGSNKDQVGNLHHFSKTFDCAPRLKTPLLSTAPWSRMLKIY